MFSVGLTLFTRNCDCAGHWTVCTQQHHRWSDFALCWQGQLSEALPGRWTLARWVPVSFQSLPVLRAFVIFSERKQRVWPSSVTVLHGYKLPWARRWRVGSIDESLYGEAGHFQCQDKQTTNSVTCKGPGCRIDECQGWCHCSQFHDLVRIPHNLSTQHPETFEYPHYLLF